MATETNSTELEDGEINDLEDGEIESDEEPKKTTQNGQKHEAATPRSPNLPTYSRSYLNQNHRNSRDIRDNGPPWIPTRRKGDIPQVRPMEERDWGPPRMRVRPSFRGHGPSGNRSAPGHFDRPNNGSWIQRGPPKFSPPQLPLRPPAPPLMRSRQITPPEEKESPSKGDTDDFDLLLERHKLIQQQLEALEKQEQAALDEEVIDDSYVDIPVEDLRRKDQGNNNNEDDDFEIGDGDSRDAERKQEKPKAFAPFKIRPLRPHIPSLKELSQKESKSDGGVTEVMQAPSVTDSCANATIASDNPSTLPKIKVQIKNQSVTARRKRRRARRRNRKAEMRWWSYKRKDDDTESSAPQSVPPVDAHSELEEKLLTLAVTPLDDMASSQMREGDAAERQKKRRERLKQWRKARSVNRDRGPSPGRRKNVAAFDQDDYLEAPMDVESDTGDGPELPLIEQAGDSFPPPPPPGEIQSYDPLYPSQTLATQMPPNLYGFYPPGQLMYTEWASNAHQPQDPSESSTLKADQQRDAQESEIEQHELSRASEPQGDDDDDDNDEASLLRELLLKSVAKKRAAKTTLSKDENSETADQPSQPATTTASLKPQNNKQKDSSNRNSTKATSRKQPQPMMYAPPTHKPVVIQLGQDSDDSDEDEAYKQQPPGGSGWGFFGSLDQMIKQARQSVEKSKVQSISHTKQANTRSKQEEEPMSAVPKTPDALNHLSEDRKAEYRLLKEQLAQREGKRRLPLTDVNQEKGEPLSSEGTADERADEREESSAMAKLREKAQNSEQNLEKHRKLLEDDRALLTKLTTLMTKKTSLLENQELRIKKLREQLEVLESAASSSKNIVKRLHAKATVVKERIRKKTVVISNAEEEYLRAKSLVSAARINPGLCSTGGVDVENLSVTDQRTSAAKRGHGAAEGALSDQSSTKRARLDSPSKTTRKQVIAERIAQEKARLQILEKELAAKLRDYGRNSDSSSTNSNIPHGKSIQINSTTTPGTLSAGQDYSSSASNDTEKGAKDVERTNDSVKSKTSSSPMEIDDSMSDKSHKTESEVLDFAITEKQLEYVNKLQSEKQSKGLVFPEHLLESPVPLHKRHMQCIYPSTSTSSIVASTASLENLRWLDQRVENQSAQEERDGGVDVPVPLTPYDSTLLYFKSYRLSPYFRTRSNLLLSSPSYSNKISPKVLFCKYDIQGVCNDVDCAYQHLTDYMLTETETLEDLASYLSEEKAKKTREELEKKVATLVGFFKSQYEGKVSSEQLYVLLANNVKNTRKLVPPYAISLSRRLVRPRQGKKNVPAEEDVPDKARGVLNIKGGVIAGHSGLAAHKANEECQEIRYFSEAYNCVEALATAVKDTPNDVELWIKLAQLRLNQKQSDVHSPSRLQEAGKANLIQALDTLSRGLEANANSEKLWLEYLQLYSLQSTREDQQELFEQALEFVPDAYSIWWQYLRFSTTYQSKRSVCYRLLAFLTNEGTHSKMSSSTRSDTQSQRDGSINTKDTHSDTLSHRVLETVLYLAQVELHSGRLKEGINTLKCVLGKGTPDDHDTPVVVTSLTPSDLLMMWLAYIHVFEFHHLPQLWFDPNDGQPSRMVNKEVFVFPWKVGKGTSSPSEKLLAMFHDALKACTVRNKLAPEKISLCLPLYSNLIALERAYERNHSAKGICRRLLQGASSQVELWLYLAALEEATGTPQNAIKVFEEGLKKTGFNARLSYCVARFHLEQGNPEAAIQSLVQAVQAKFTHGAQASVHPTKHMTAQLKCQPTADIQETALPSTNGTAQSASQAISPSSNQGSAPSVSQVTTPSSNQGSAPSVIQVTTPSSNQGSAPSVSQVKTPSSIQGSAQSVIQVTTPSSNQGLALSVIQVTTPSSNQGSSPASSAFQVTTPSSNQGSSPALSATPESAPSVYHAGADPVILYRKLLSQPLPYDCKPPPLKPGVDVHDLGEEGVYLWLGYCLFLELSPSASPICHQYNLSASACYETAVHSTLDRQQSQAIWLEYLFYTRDRAGQGVSTAGGLRALGDLVNRCLVSFSTSIAFPHSASNVWQDFRFHNKVINLYLGCLPEDSHQLVYDKYLKWYPQDLHLAQKACEHMIATGSPNQAKRIAVQFLSENPHCASMWQIAISLELQRNHSNEARKLYEQSTGTLPLAATLWKDYLMFAVSRSKDDPSTVTAIAKKCRENGVDIQDFLETLLGRIS
ncbi:zinc finger C3H1 domain-containing protein isoform X2 [Nematostella vectensis]|uniref:zinc finger C3H1 domain-containing protein isoform X2 n=1 Tax=Nematostella vectensis TaxID=45351 RepID=UPI0020770D2D|nr:zinc finger C3H1 domain-containing protein isoform X2 [Nematostella vectensis]